ncbi:hypothetical protein JR316_0011467 [Psilocybe cubensis]|uniref:Uncharacterized protein n=2 Tax=Psilocybe cubensis TaxID=181762 RepID=A0A8H7XUL3_PSICU|nr:hypothetical protein JR316_0011467 [Psilocybe cubensis]KAH9475906.1 hypothetical protein JR316_0011467 [Psilocybe cubensis]
MLPGFGLPVNHVPQKGDPEYIDDLYCSALSPGNLYHGFINQRLTTLREFTMMQLMNTITDKPGWQIKVYDPKISYKWKEEALSSGKDISSKMVDWCIDELRYKASLIPDSAPHPPPIVVYNGDVVKSDYAVSPELKIELQNAVKAFEDKIPEHLKDWHPDSDEKVLDLVHPSLYPLVYGLTRVLPDGQITTLDDCIQRSGQGSKSIDNPRGIFGPYRSPYSAKFQWLPCEVDISGEEARITSYINNLHPQEDKPLYKLISKLITVSIPLWNLTMAPLRKGGWGGSLFLHSPRIHYNKVVYDPDPANWPEQEGPQPDHEEGEDRDDDMYLQRRQAWIESTRRIVLPEPGVFKPLPSPPPFSLKDKYGARGLQVIVKLANIELTPDKPEYNGGSWHIEGQMNEHIVATSIYYYSSSNITTSSLSFRQQCWSNIDYDIDYPVGSDYEWLLDIFGCERNEPTVQFVGSVMTPEGRLLTFPNILQHRVEPFKLEDPTKPGHRKIVALFLVDPNIKIISTANVPCQRADWVLNADSSSARSEDGFPITEDAAKDLKLELMEERKEFAVNHGIAFEAMTISLCEH